MAAIKKHIDKLSTHSCHVPGNIEGSLYKNSNKLAYGEEAILSNNEVKIFFSLEVPSLLLAPLA